MRRRVSEKTKKIPTKGLNNILRLPPLLSRVMPSKVMMFGWSIVFNKSASRNTVRSVDPSIIGLKRRRKGK